MFVVSGTIVPETTNICLILVDKLADLGWSDRRRASQRWVPQVVLRLGWVVLICWRRADKRAGRGDRLAGGPWAGLAGRAGRSAAAWRPGDSAAAGGAGGRRAGCC